MKKIIKYTSIAVLGLGLFASCTEKFEEMNTSNIQVDPSDMPLESQCVEPMNYCYPPQQNMFQFWTNLTVDLYSGYFMTTETSPTVTWERTADTAAVCMKTTICIYSTIHAV